jgi:thiamine biosynthesis lipoprotein
VTDTGTDAKRLLRVEECMGTVFTIDVRAPGVGDAVVDEVLDWLHEMDATFSTYRPDSPVNRLAAGELELAECPGIVRNVLNECERFRGATDGFFDCRYSGALDPSGYVKGWAIERASELLERHGSRNHCVNGGGDVQCIGYPEPGQQWTVGIIDPCRRDRVVATVSGARLAVATSGSAERGQHIIDPHTKRPANTYASVSVVGERLSEVDVWATAAAAMGERAEAWLRARTVRALLIRPDGSMRTVP